MGCLSGAALGRSSLSWDGIRGGQRKPLSASMLELCRGMQRIVRGRDCLGSRPAHVIPGRRPVSGVGGIRRLMRRIEGIWGVRECTKVGVWNCETDGGGAGWSPCVGSFCGGGRDEERADPGPGMELGGVPCWGMACCVGLFFAQPPSRLDYRASNGLLVVPRHCKTSTASLS